MTLRHDAEKIFWLFLCDVALITVTIIVMAIAVTVYVAVRVNFSLPSAIPKCNP